MQLPAMLNTPGQMEEVPQNSPAVWLLPLVPRGAQLPLGLSGRVQCFPNTLWTALSLPPCFACVSAPCYCSGAAGRITIKMVKNVYLARERLWQTPIRPGTPCCTYIVLYVHCSAASGRTDPWPKCLQCCCSSLGLLPLIHEGISLVGRFPWTKLANWVCWEVWKLCFLSWEAFL